MTTQKAMKIGGVKVLRPKNAQMARDFARSIVEHQHRNDHGGTYHQARRNLQDIIWTNRGAKSGHLLPDGGIEADLGDAVEAWASLED